MQIILAIVSIGMCRLAIMLAFLIRALPLRSHSLSDSTHNIGNLVLHPVPQNEKKYPADYTEGSLILRK